MQAELVAALLLVTLTAGGVTAQPRYTLAQVFRTGSVDGPDALTTPGPTTLLPDGGIAVTQRQDGAVKVYGPDGRLKTTIGRSGRGPGEFRHIAAIGLSGDTAIWVSDVGNRRLPFFDFGGQLRAEITWPGLDRTPYRPVLNGSAFLAADIREGTADSDSMWAIRTYSRAGVLLDTIGVYRSGQATLNIGGRSVANPLSSGMIAAYSQDGSRAVLVDRTISRTGQRSTFALMWLDLRTKQTVGRQTFSYSPIPISAELLDRLAARYRASGAPGAYGAGLIEALRKLRFLPPVSAAVSADKSAVWIGRETNSGRPTTRWYHISADAGIAGYVELPSTSRILHARHRTIVVSEQGDFDVPYVAVYQIRGQ
jgi:hypothetical protein